MEIQTKYVVLGVIIIIIAICISYWSCSLLNKLESKIVSITVKSDTQPSLSEAKNETSIFDI